MAERLSASPAGANRVKIIGCATVIEEMQAVRSDGVDYKIMDYGLHLAPANLRQALQDEIDAAGSQYDTVILGYGLCSLAVVGLQARSARLVVPKVDDCIALFLGSRAAYTAMSKQEPGTYYLTKGWIEVGDTILEDYRRSVERLGEQRAARVMGQMFKHYKRLVYIDTGCKDQDAARAYAQETASTFNLRYEEFEGSPELIRKLLLGPWDSEFLVIEPGRTIKYQDFMRQDAEKAGPGGILSGENLPPSGLDAPPAQ